MIREILTIIRETVEVLDTYLILVLQSHLDFQCQYLYLFLILLYFSELFFVSARHFLYYIKNNLDSITY